MIERLACWIEPYTVTIVDHLPPLLQSSVFHQAVGCPPQGDLQHQCKLRWFDFCGDVTCQQRQGYKH